ncbi:MAG: precorrin-3B C(17)-methyltransferase [Ruminococcus sp.]|nr:precorrin-3B C(17)-methyltransferase [Ruminococcus sp.]
MKIFVIGFGSGDRKYMTEQAIFALKSVDLIIGYQVYIDLLKKEFPDLNYSTSPMRKEIERCKFAVQEALKNKNIALVSSGDSGIYGMAGILLEIVQDMQAEIEIEIVAGITSASLASSVLGAPLMHDFSVISLSDLLTPLELIYKRISCAAQGDFVICIYNPKSKSRTEYLAQACELIMQYQSPDTPVGIVRNAGRENQKAWFTSLKELKNQPIDMFCVIIIGNSQSYIKNNYMITPRGYKI